MRDYPFPFITTFGRPPVAQAKSRVIDPEKVEQAVKVVMAVTYEYEIRDSCGAVSSIPFSLYKVIDGGWYKIDGGWYKIIGGLDPLRGHGQHAEYIKRLNHRIREIEMSKFWAREAAPA
jgi:hypothetical protein